MLENDQIRQTVITAADLVADAPPDLREAAFRVILQYLLGAHAQGAPSSHGSAALIPQSRGLSINEFLAAVAPSTHVERVASIAYHAYHTDGSGITTRDVTEAYAKARTKKPQNIPEVIGMCIKRGYLFDADKKDGLKAWQITPSGERFVEALMKTSESAPE